MIALRITSRVQVSNHYTCADDRVATEYGPTTQLLLYIRHTPVDGLITTVRPRLSGQLGALQNGFGL